jgi:rare lipoprotein A
LDHPDDPIPAMKTRPVPGIERERTKSRMERSWIMPLEGPWPMPVRRSAAVCGMIAVIVLSPAAQAQSGIASVYGYHGSRTASGERASPGALTAAHRTLPFGARVRVTNRRNGKSVVVRINDRGPFIKGRIIDITPAAARALGFSGLAPVKIERVGG